jgi:KDO2-lipid IV(A) lauroyltransferase
MLAWMMVRLVPRKLSRYAVARDNLRQAFGARYSPAQIDDLIRRMWVHLFRLVAELVQFPRKFRLENCREAIVFRNRQAAVRAMSTGRPVFVLGGHFGNWEASPASWTTLICTGGF